MGLIGRGVQAIERLARPGDGALVIRQPDGSLSAPTHAPLITLDNEQLYKQFMSKQLGFGAGALAGGGGIQQGRLYRTGPQRLRQLAATYGGTTDSVSWVFASVSYVAQTHASYPYHFEDGKGDKVEDEQVPADLARLITKPNQRWTYFDLAEMMQVDVELVGNGYLLKNQRNGLGQPKTLHRLRPDCVRIATAPDGTVVGYVYTPPTVEGGYGSIPIPYDADEVIHFSYANPLDEHYGMGTVEAIAGVLDEHTAERLHVTGFFQNGARISGVLTVADNLSDVQFERLKRSYAEQFEGAANAYRVLIAERANDFKPISTAPVAAGVVDLMRLSKDEILSAFTIPAPLLGGVMENANYKMEESQHIFLRGMIPRSTKFAERLTEDLVGLWRLTFKVEPHANEPMEVRISHAQGILRAGGKINESRDILGLEPSDDPMAEVPLVENTLIPVGLVGAPPRPGRSIPLGDQGEPGAHDVPPEGGGSAPAAAGPPIAQAASDAQAAFGKTTEEQIAEAVERLASMFERRMQQIESEVASKDAEVEPAVAVGAGGSAAVSAAVSAPDPAGQPRQAGALSARRGSRDALTAAAEAAAAWGGRRRRHLSAVPDEDDWRMPDFPSGCEPPAPIHEKRALVDEQRAVREHQARTLRAGVDIFVPALRKFFREERDRVMHALAQFGSTQQHARRGRGKKDLTPEQVFDLTAENAALVDAYLASLDQVMAVAVDTPAALTGSVSWTLENPEVVRVRDQMAQLVTRVNDTTRQAIADVVQEGMRRGYSVAQIANGVPAEQFPGVMGVFDEASDLRAETIARTESGMAFNQAIALGYADAGTKWVLVMDGLGDAACAEANGSIWSLDDFQGDPLGHPNCTRTAVPSSVGPDGQATGAGDGGLGDAGA